MAQVAQVITKKEQQMKRFRRPVRLARTTLALLALPLLSAGVALAQTTTYKLQPVATLGDKVGDLTLSNAFEVGTLNDAGQLVFATYTQALFIYADGNIIPIAAAGKTAPGGTWGKRLEVWMASMNQRGNAAVGTYLTQGGKDTFGTFLWRSKEQTITTIAVKGMPAAQNLTFGETSYSPPVINNRDQVAFDGDVQNAAGEAVPGVFVSEQGGKLVPIALPDGDLPGGQKVHLALSPSIDDAGRVAFVARRQSGGGESAYLWEQGTISPIAIIGADAPGGGKFEAITAVRLNNKNRSVLVAARLQDERDFGLYLFAEGSARAVAVPGQPMPGGGTFQTLETITVPGFWEGIPYELSYANELGQHAFVAVLEDGSTAAYRMDADGKLSLILQSGQTTELGPIEQIGQGIARTKGIGLNSKGQVALVVRVADGPATLVLLTPTAP
jgi:hypothetical protein